LALDIDDLRPERVSLPIVLVGERLFGAPYDHVAPDNVAAARLATEHLLGLGRRRIAAIGIQDSSAGASARMRLQGYSDALRATDQAIDPRLLAPAPFRLTVRESTVGRAAMMRDDDADDAYIGQTPPATASTLRGKRLAALVAGLNHSWPSNEDHRQQHA